MTFARETDPYSSAVRQKFAKPVHAGAMPDEYNDVLYGEASEPGTGFRVVLAAVIDGETIRLLRYRVFGCPHLIAAVEAFCEQAEGQRISVLNEPDIEGLIDRLAIPVQKTGRLFILEDAARALHIATTGSTETRG